MNQDSSPIPAAGPHLVITGPTASGKGQLAAELARRLDAEIVSVDSMKVYRGLDIGTAKPSPELRRELRYHLIDIVDPWSPYSVGDFLPEVFRVIEELERAGRRAILQGGTAFYLNALIHGLFEAPAANPELREELERRVEEEGLGALHAELRERDPGAALKIHAHDRKRIIRALEVIILTGRTMTEQWSEPVRKLEPGSYRLIGIEHDREDLYRRIDRRVLVMVERGLFEEVERLLADPRGLGPTARKCIGYRQIIEGRERGEDRETIIETIQRDSRRFARQQLTWFRRLEPRWLEPAETGVLADRVLEAE